MTAVDFGRRSGESCANRCGKVVRGESPPKLLRNFSTRREMRCRPGRGAESRPAVVAERAFEPSLPRRHHRAGALVPPPAYRIGRARSTVRGALRTFRLSRRLFRSAGARACDGAGGPAPKPWRGVSRRPRQCGHRRPMGLESAATCCSAASLVAARRAIVLHRHPPERSTSCERRGVVSEDRGWHARCRRDRVQPAHIVHRDACGSHRVARVVAALGR